MTKQHDALDLFSQLIKYNKNNPELALEQLGDIDENTFKELQALIAAHHQNKQQTWFSDAISSQVNQLTTESDLSGQQISHFTLQHKLGEGGMGTVYKAQRHDDKIKQDVAIKLINPAITALYGESEVLREAQFLATLNHAYIAKVLDVGESELGAYIIMEYIEGDTLLSYCQQHQLTNKARLVLFNKICDAVSYAHQNRVIHADLKPNNILITKSGDPKLVDFGIARAASMNESSNQNCYHEYIKALSHEYASPEQQNGGTITTQSDVYSLGKILESLLSKADHEQKQVINHALKPIELRYSSTEQLKNDITNILNNRPISTNTDQAYRFKKLLKRNPVSSILAAGLTLSVAAFSYSLWQKNIALEIEKQTSDNIANFMVDVFKSADPQSYDGHPVNTRDLLLFAKSKLDSNELVNSEKLQLHLGRSFKGIGDFDNAVLLLNNIKQDEKLKLDSVLDLAGLHISRSNLEKASELLNSINPNTLSEAQKIAFNIAKGKVAFYQDDTENAHSLFTQAKTSALATHNYQQVVTTNNLLTGVLQKQENFSAQLELAKDNLQFSEQHFPHNSTEHIHAMFTLQSAYSAVEDFEQAAPLIKKIYDIQSQIYPKDHPTIALTLNELGNALSRLEKYDEAIKYHKEAINIITPRFNDRHIDYVYGHAYLGNAYSYQQQFDEAIAAYKNAADASLKLYGETASFTLTSYRNLGLAYQESGEHTKALEVLKTNYANTLKGYDKNSFKAATVQTALGSTYMALEQWQNAKILLEQAKETFEQKL
ncbi:MAG: serine/threonine-protein kinase, partial [Pseudomonadota bacterium]